MNAVIEKPLTKTVAKKVAPAPKREIHIGGALNCLQDLLDRAWKTGDPEQGSGDSNRLLSSARYIVGHLQNDHTDESRLECGLYDVAAQIKAALLVPGDSPSAERVALIGQMGVLLSDLADDPLILKNWAPPASETPAKASNEVELSEAVPIVRSLVAQAMEILWNAGDNSGADEVWGVYNLAEWLDAQLENEENSIEPKFGILGVNTETTMAVLSIVNDQHDCILMHGAYTILKVAREMLQEAEEQVIAAKKATQEARP